ncbi:MAG: GIY-YIG nuclease family protein [Chloroflexota bacterium]
MTSERPWYVYVVECRDGSLYTGMTLDVLRRVGQHNKGRGARYTASRRPVSLKAAWRYSSRVAAMKAEARYKQYPLKKKRSMLSGTDPLLDGSPHVVKTQQEEEKAPEQSSA